VGPIYYFSVRVVVGAAHGAAVSSDGIQVDVTLPTSSVDPLPSVVTTERFLVTWTGSDEASGIAAYNIQYKDGAGEWGDFYGWNPATSLDFPAEDGHTYYFRSRAFDNAGNAETFPDVPDAMTTVDWPVIRHVAWVHDGLGADVDWTNCGAPDEFVGLSANWAATSGVDGYQYAIGTAPGDSDVFAWNASPIVTDTHASESEPTYEEGSTYYFSVRGVIGSRHGDSTSSDGVGVDLTPPVSRVDSLPDRTHTKVFNVSWGGTDALSGLSSYTIQVKDGSTGGAQYQDWLAGTTLTSADFTGEDGHTYYFVSHATDSAGNVEGDIGAADAWTTVECAYVFVRTWGSEGTGPLELDGPAGVEVDASGNVWVADTDNARVQKFSPDGDFLMQLGGPGSGDGKFTRPTDVAFDDSGYVYVPDRTEHRIQKFTSGGTFVKKWGTWGDGEGELSSPYALDVDDSGYVYVADTGNERVQKFTSKGVFVKAWGDSGSGEGQFRNPRGIAVDGSSAVYVSDADNRTIQKFTTSGVRLTGWGCSGSADGCLNMPYKVGVDDSGYVYVADLGNHRIQKFTSGGDFVAKFGSFGTDEGELDYPSGVALGDSGCVYTVEHMLNRVQKFRWSCP
jgi:YHS domain-containing protein